LRYEIHRGSPSRSSLSVWVLGHVPISYTPGGEIILTGQVFPPYAGAFETEPPIRVEWPLLQLMEQEGKYLSVFIPQRLLTKIFSSASGSRRASRPYASWSTAGYRMMPSAEGRKRKGTDMKLLMFTMLAFAAFANVRCPVHNYATCYYAGQIAPSGARLYHCSCGDDVWAK
jgi:hypothetical protein